MEERIRMHSSFFSEETRPQEKCDNNRVCPLTLCMLFWLVCSFVFVFHFGGEIFIHLNYLSGRRGGLMVRVLDSGSSGPGLGSGPGRGHYVVLLGKTLYSHGASLHPGV